MKTKIIATIGPASSELKTLKEMKKAGMSIARLNTKYASESWHKKVFEKLKKINCEIMIDIKSLDKIKFFRDWNFDYLALSYTESVSQIKKVRKLFDKKIKIVAKIENKKGLKNLDSIIREADGVMVARGDLSKNISFEKVPKVQKSILGKAQKFRKMDITATEMLLSMVNSRRPTNSEVSDVANAVFDGSEGVMLSEETAIGKYPVLGVKTMKKIVKEIEKE
jgi:pyruvate kinase